MPPAKSLAPRAKTPVTSLVPRATSPGVKRVRTPDDQLAPVDQTPTKTPKQVTIRHQNDRTSQTRAKSAPSPRRSNPGSRGRVHSWGKLRSHRSSGRRSPHGSGSIRRSESKTSRSSKRRQRDEQKRDKHAQKREKSGFKIGAKARSFDAQTRPDDDTASNPYAPGQGPRSMLSTGENFSKRSSGFPGSSAHTGDSNNKKPDFSKPKCNVQGFSKTGDFESWLHPHLQKFCHGIVAKLYQSNSNRNFLMSPVTCYITVGMLCGGAKGRTRNQISRLLCVKQKRNYALDEAASILKHITNDKEFKVYYTDGVFVDNDYPITETFEKVVKKYFDTDVMNANFKSTQEAPEIMNKWLEEQTNGRIREIVHKTKKNSLLYVCNTTYMRSQWSMEFPRKLTREGDFHTSDKIVKVDYMNKADTFECVNVA